MARQVRRPAEFRRAKPPYYEYEEESVVQQEEDFVEDYQPLPDPSAIVSSLIIDIPLEPIRAVDVEVRSELSSEHRIIAQNVEFWEYNFFREASFQRVESTDLSDPTYVLRSVQTDNTVDAYSPQTTAIDDRNIYQDVRSEIIDDRVNMLTPSTGSVDEVYLETRMPHWLYLLTFYGPDITLHVQDVGRIYDEIDAAILRTMLIDDRETSLIPRSEIQEMEISAREIFMAASPEVTLREIRSILAQADVEPQVPRTQIIDVEQAGFVPRSAIIDNEVQLTDVRPAPHDDTVSLTQARSQEVSVEANADTTRSLPVDIEQQTYSPRVLLEEPEVSPQRHPLLTMDIEMASSIPHVTSVEETHIPVASAREASIDVSMSHPSAHATEDQVEFTIPTARAHIVEDQVDIDAEFMLEEFVEVEQFKTADIQELIS